MNEDGWRLYRIPLTDPNIYEVVNNSSAYVPPTLKKVSYGRLIMETNLPAKVLIYDFNIVGNKWEDFYVRNPEGQIIPDVQVNNYNTSYLSGIVNNQKNSLTTFLRKAALYRSAPRIQRIRAHPGSGKPSPGHQGAASRGFSILTTCFLQ